MFFAIYELMTLFVIPATLMIFCYFRVIRELWTSTRVITILTAASAGRQYNRQTTITNSTNSTMNNLSTAGGVAGSSKYNDTTAHNRSYLVRWPGRTKQPANEDGSNCQQKLPPQPPPPPQSMSKKVANFCKRSKEAHHHHQNSVTSSGVSSSSTSGVKNAKKKAASKSPEVSEGHLSNQHFSENLENGTLPPPPDSPAGLSTSSSQCAKAGGAGTPSRLSKLYYCVHNLRTLLWLRGPSACAAQCRLTRSCCKKKKRKVIGGHRGHHRCHYHQKHFKTTRNSGRRHQSHQKEVIKEGTKTPEDSMSYQQIKSCCCYQRENGCTMCSKTSGLNGAPVDSEKMSNVSCSSVTCPTSTSNGALSGTGNRNGLPSASKRSSDSAYGDDGQLPVSRGQQLFHLLRQTMSHLCFCQNCLLLRRKSTSGLPAKPTFNNGYIGCDSYKMESPFEMRKAMQSFAASPINPAPSPEVAFAEGSSNLAQSRRGLAGSGYATIATSSFTSNHNHQCSYNMLSASGSCSNNTLRAPGHTSSYLPQQQGPYHSQSVTSMALPPSNSNCSVYHHSTTSGYRAPVTDVRNARKQVWFVF